MRPLFSPVLQSGVLPSFHGSFLGAADRLSWIAAPTTTSSTASFLETTTTTIIANNNNNDAFLLDLLWNPESVVTPLNAASEPWIRSLVWVDFKVAVAFFVVAPLLLLFWAVVTRIPPNSNNNNNNDQNPSNDTTNSTAAAETVLRYMTSYWQASSLLLLTLTLDVQEKTVCVVAGLLAQAMIVVSLWWWEDLNEELVLFVDSNKKNDDSSSSNNSSIGSAFILWRNVATLAASAGVIIQVPFQTCVSSDSLVESAYCAPWLEPPQFASSLIGVAASPTLELLTWSGCALYAFVLTYYVVVLIPSVGRQGRAARPEIMNVVTPIGVWQRMGFLDGESEE